MDRGADIGQEGAHQGTRGHREAQPVGTVGDLGGQERARRVAQDALALAVPDLEVIRQRERELDQRAVEERHSCLDGMRHRVLSV